MVNKLCILSQDSLVYKAKDDLNVIGVLFYE
jgi:hypothetical protein